MLLSVEHMQPLLVTLVLRLSFAPHSAHMSQLRSFPVVPFFLFKLKLSLTREEVISLGQETFPSAISVHSRLELSHSVHLTLAVHKHAEQSLPATQTAQVSPLSIVVSHAIACLI